MIWNTAQQELEELRKQVTAMKEQEPVAWLFDTEEDGKYWYDQCQPCGRPVFAAPLPEPAPQKSDELTSGIGFATDKNTTPSVGAVPSLKHKLMKKPKIIIINSFYKIGKKLPDHWQHIFIKQRFRYDPPSQT